MAKKDLYKILGLEKNASEADIKKAYRKLSKLYHPDVKETGDESKFKEIAEAHEILMDPEKKAKHENEDMFGGAQGFHGGFNMADELFKNFGGFHFNTRRQSQTVKPKGGDLRIKIAISLDEIVTGVHKKIKLQRNINCTHCSGSGGKNKDSVIDCDSCNGTGTVTTRQQTSMGILVQQYTCVKCNGVGKEIKEKCTSCHGEGLVSNSDNIEFDIPPGAVQGVNLNINNLGNEAKGGGENGNLIIEINEIEHPTLKKEGLDILSDIFISYYDAVIGNESLEVETVDGTAKIKIEPGTESGKLLRLRGKGIPNINNFTQRGDQLVFVNIFIPKTITEEEAKTINKLKNLKSAEPNKEKTQHLKGVYSRIREYDELH